MIASLNPDIQYSNITIDATITIILEGKVVIKLFFFFEKAQAPNKLAILDITTQPIFISNYDQAFIALAQCRLIRIFNRSAAGGRRI